RQPQRLPASTAPLRHPLRGHQAVERQPPVLPALLEVRRLQVVASPVPWDDGPSTGTGWVPQASATEASVGIDTEPRRRRVTPHSLTRPRQIVYSYLCRSKGVA